MALQLDLGQPRLEETRLTAVPHVPPLTANQSASVRESVRLMQPWRLPFMYQQQPDFPMRQQQMLKAINQWSEPELREAWAFALEVTHAGPTSTLGQNATSEPHFLPLGLCTGLCTLLSESRRQELRTQLVASLVPEMSLSERCLRLMVGVICGPQVFATCPDVTKTITRLLPLCQHVLASKNDKRRLRQEELMRRLSACIKEDAPQLDGPSNPPQMLLASKRALIRAQRDSLELQGSRAEMGFSLIRRPSSGSPHRGLHRPYAHLATPPSSLSRRSSYSSHALGSPWVAASPASDADWNLVDTVAKETGE